MGLTIDIGMLSQLGAEFPEETALLRESFAKVNEVLDEAGLPTHEEPEEIPQIGSRCSTNEFSYSSLHHLRRFYARFTEDDGWVPSPTPDGEDPSDDEVLEEESDMMMSHLLCHSDCEGFYFPIDIEDIVMDFAGDRIPGGMLGSSFRLMEELEVIAPALGIKFTDGNLTDSDARQLNEIADSDDPFRIEKAIWFCLYESARLSLKHGSAICFA